MPIYDTLGDLMGWDNADVSSKAFSRDGSLRSRNIGLKDFTFFVRGM